MAGLRLRILWSGVIACALAAALGCDGSGSVPATVTVTIKDEAFTLDVAADEASRTLGLGGRETIPADGGMIFIFPRAEQQRFWMLARSPAR